MEKKYYKELFKERKQFCDSLIDFISTISPPEIDFSKEDYPEEIEDKRVISVDAAWGYGKTTFMKALKEKLKENNFTVFTFNAWANDYEGDPLEAFINELIPQMLNEINYNKDNEDETTETISLLLAAGNELIRNFSKFDVIEYIERVQSNKKYIQTNYLSKKNSLKNFEKDSPLSKQKKEFIASLNTYYNDVIKIHKNRSNKKIVILIDELDRCKPTFAIELLERIKHLFDTGKYLFIFTINSNQLIESVKQIYGNCFDEAGYFRRFFDYEFFLPEPDISEYLRETQEKMQLKFPTNSKFIKCVHDSVPKNLSLRDYEKINKFIEKILVIQNREELTENEMFFLTIGLIINFIDKPLFYSIYVKKENYIKKSSNIDKLNKIFMYTSMTDKGASLSTYLMDGFNSFLNIPLIQSLQKSNEKFKHYNKIKILHTKYELYFNTFHDSNKPGNQIFDIVKITTGEKSLVIDQKFNISKLINLLTFGHKKDD